MREIINIQIGQCGNRIGNAFWTHLEQENTTSSTDININNQQQQKLCNSKYPEMYFYHTKKGIKYSRSILADLQPSTLDEISNGPIRHLFRQQNIISGNCGSANLYAKGRYASKNQFQSYIMDAIRRQMQLCDTIQGFHFLHSVGGGTGSGLGSLILQNLASQYKYQIKQSATLVPGWKNNSQNVLQIYNTVLCMENLVQNLNQTILFDNKSLYQKVGKQTKTKKGFEEENKLIASALLATTASSRFPSQLNSTLRKALTNLVPFPKLHFFIVSQLIKQREQYYERALIRQSLNNKNILSSVDLDQGTIVTVSANFMGRQPLSSSVIQWELFQSLNNSSSSSYYVNWLANNYHISVCTNNKMKHDTQSTYVINTTAIKSLFVDFSQKFQKMLKKKNRLYWYINQGMEEMEFITAETNLRTIINDFPNRDNEN